jgi:dTDP-glucose 4,6-dehydratase
VEGTPLPVYGTGTNIRDWIYVYDHADALIRMAEDGQPGERFTIGGNCERSNLDVVQAICARIDLVRPERAPHANLIKFVADRPGHDFRYGVDASRAASRLGWTPKQDFDSGLDLTVHWYLQMPDWWQPLRKTVYDGSRLGRASATA